MPLKPCRSPHGERGLKSFCQPKAHIIQLSLPSRGAWIEMARYGILGMDGILSLPSRGAWIEIPSIFLGKEVTKCRSPHGERGLKSGGQSRNCFDSCRSPHGERGLKFCTVHGGKRQDKSLPSRGAWIEIIPEMPSSIFLWGRSPHGERGLK